MTNPEIIKRIDDMRSELAQIKSMLTEPRIRRARVKSKSTKHFDKYLLK